MPKRYIARRRRSGKDMRRINMIIRNIAVAFSIYSKIPMPHFKWEEEDMKYNLVFLPFIGIVIGLLTVIASLLGMRIGINDTAVALILAAIPLIITGGFHVDGFMDVSDALSSYKTKEEKRAILKDPHIGAFAVIRLCCCGLLFVSALIIIQSQHSIKLSVILGIVFYLVRCMTGLTSLYLPLAKEDGMLSWEKKGATKGMRIILTLEALVGVICLAIVNLIVAIIVVIIEVIFTLYYKRLCDNQFGGISGDTAGYYTVTGELLACIGIAVVSLFM